MDNLKIINYLLSHTGLAAVEGDAGPAVVPLDHAARVVGVDPQVMVIVVGGAHLGEGPAPIHRLPALIV